MSDPDGATCGEPTAEGPPCRARPLAGKGGRCYQHAGLPRTEAQNEAARRNAVKNGYFATGLSDLQPQRYDRILEGLGDRPGLQREMAAYAVLRAARLADWEAERGEPCPLTATAFAAAARAVKELPQGAEQERRRIDDEELAVVVAALSADPEVFLKGLPPAVQDEVRAVLRKAEKAPQPAAQGSEAGSQGGKDHEPA